jgi:hypothetical protein
VTVLNSPLLDEEDRVFVDASLMRQSPKRS